MPTFNQAVPGQTDILAELGIRNNPDLPVADMARIRGGNHTVATLAQRNAIPGSLLKVGVTRCRVDETSTTYLLTGTLAGPIWIPELATPALLVNDALPLVRGRVGQVLSIDIPHSLFKSAGGDRDWRIVSIQGVPNGLGVSTDGLSIGGGSPSEAGRFTVVINAIDTEGYRAQYVLLMQIEPAIISSNPSQTTPTQTTPAAATTVGAAAINIVAPSQAVCAIVLTTQGLAETGGRAYAVANGQRFIGDSSVTTALAFGSAGYSTASNGGIGYYSFGFNLAAFRSRYPSVYQVSFDVLVTPTPTPYYINRVNYSYLLSNGFVAQSLSNGFDYDYANPGSETKGFWHYNHGSADGQQNTVDDLHDQFTLAGGEERKIGTMSLNMQTGVCRFLPVGISPATGTGTGSSAGTGSTTNPTTGSGGGSTGTGSTTNPSTGTGSTGSGTGQPVATDYIDSILRKEVGTDVVYLIRMANWAYNDARPIIRSRNAAETAWRGSGWVAWLPDSASAPQFATEYNQGYHHVWRGNLSLNNEPDFSMVIQFNDYLNAPDASIIEDSYQATTAPAETEVYNAQDWRADTSDGTDGYTDSSQSSQPTPTYTDQALPVASPGWLQARISYNSAMRQLIVDVDPTPDNLPIQLKVGRQDGQAFQMGNAQNPLLNSDTFYGYGPLQNQGGYTENWTYGQKGDGTGGVPAVGIVLTFLRTDTGAQFAVRLVPKDGVNQPLIDAPPVTQPSSSTPTSSGSNPQAEQQSVNYTSTSNDDGGPVN